MAVLTEPQWVLECTGQRRWRELSLQTQRARGQAPLYGLEWQGTARLRSGWRDGVTKRHSHFQHILPFALSLFLSDSHGKGMEMPGGLVISSQNSLGLGCDSCLVLVLTS